jgi:hypothetical protein
LDASPARAVKTTDKRTCRFCNTLLDGNSDVCPVCALKSALESENHATATELRFEHYQILKNEDQSLIQLDHGAMGVTYKALDVQLQRPVALKIINAKLIGDASARQRFVREARAAASVRPQRRHSNGHRTWKSVQALALLGHFFDSSLRCCDLSCAGAANHRLAREACSRATWRLMAAHVGS